MDEKERIEKVVADRSIVMFIFNFFNFLLYFIFSRCLLSSKLFVRYSFFMTLFLISGTFFFLSRSIKLTIYILIYPLNHPSIHPLIFLMNNDLCVRCIIYSIHHYSFPLLIFFLAKKFHFPPTPHSTTKLIMVYKQVGILSTGNELYDSLAPSSCHRSNRRRRPGLIPDANRPMLLSLLRSHQNCSLIDLGIVSDDDRIKLKRKLNDALDDCDVLITTGGISVGEKDVVEKVLTTELDCCIQFGRLHMKPGKPTTFLTRGEGDSDGGDYGVDLKKKQCLVFALPGNPVSARVCTELLVVPCLNMLFLGDADTTTPPGEKMGMMEMVEENTADIICRMVDNAYVHPEIRARLVSPSRIKLDTGRPEYHRVILDARCADSDKENGVHNYHYEATSTGVQRSSRLLSMSNADGMMLLPQGSAEGKQYAVSGEVYPVLLSPYYSSYSNNGKGVRVKDSFHLRKSNDTMTEPIISTHISIGDKKERVSSNKLNIGLLNIVGNDIEKVSSSYPSGSSKYTDDGKTKEMQNTGRPKRKLLISEPPFANKNNDLITLKQRILKVLKLCLHQDNHGVDNGDNIGEVKVVKSSSVTLLNEDTLNTSSSSYTPSSIIPQMVLELFSPSPVLNSNSNSSSIQYNENKDHSSNAIDENGVVDIVIVVCTNTDLRTSLDVSSVLRSILTATVPGKAMELESRRGAASIRPLSVLFDPVVGYVDPSNHHNCCNSKYDGRSMTFAIMVIPDGGMEGALRRVVGPLLGRGLNVARGL